jgi:hypothetical protein
VAGTQSAAPTTPDTPDTNNDELLKRIDELEVMLTDRDAALAEAQEIIERQRQQVSAKTPRARKTEELGQEERWTAISNELAEARSRYEAAELALAEIRIRAKDEGRTHQELISTRGALAAREKELADLRAKFAPLDGQAPEGEAATPAATETVEPTPSKPQYSKTFIGGVIAAACVFALLIVFYPSIEAALYPPPPPKAAPAEKQTERLEPVVVERKAVLLRDSKLRADPTNSGKTVATATKGFEVIIVESRGKWTLVRMGTDPKAQQGWVLQSALNETTPPETPATPAAK